MLCIMFGVKKNHKKSSCDSAPIKITKKLIFGKKSKYQSPGGLLRRQDITIDCINTADTVRKVCVLFPIGSVRQIINEIARRPVLSSVKIAA
uniref:Uncharacterized protein n=1 Tax=Romanomermis culicivorax TaxID=13658 RepID=A0A915I8U8_ROMCU